MEYPMQREGPPAMFADGPPGPALSAAATAAAGRVKASVPLASCTAGAVRVRVGELAREVADAVGADLGRDLQRAQHAERLAVAVDERAARVTGDARRDGVDLVAPAAAGLAEAEALLRAQLRDAQAQRGVAVGEDLVARGRRCR